MSGRGALPPAYIGHAVRHLLAARPPGENTQKWLADTAGMNTNAVAKIARSEAEPSSRVLFAIADALGTTCGRLRDLQAELAAAEPAPRPPGRPKKTPDAPEPSPNSPGSGPAGTPRRRPKPSPAAGTGG